MDSAFLFLLLAVSSRFKCLEYIDFFEKERKGQILLSGSSFGFRISLFLLFEFGNGYTFSRVVVVLVTIVSPHVGPLIILRRFAYTTGNQNCFLIIYL
jgi:hypothetical protein